jgi:hypothetical protein
MVWIGGRGIFAITTTLKVYQVSFCERKNTLVLSHLQDVSAPNHSLCPLYCPGATSLLLFFFKDGDRTTFRLWDYESGEVQKEWHLCERPVYFVTWLDSSTLLVRKNDTWYFFDMDEIEEGDHLSLETSSSSLRDGAIVVERDDEDTEGGDIFSDYESDGNESVIVRRSRDV